MQVRCWGSNSHDQLDVPGSQYLHADAGDFHACAIEDRTFRTRCWGDNEHGQSDAP